MEKKIAKQLIEKTFNASFNEVQFTLFIKNLFNDLDTEKQNEYRGQYIKDSFQEHIRQYKRIGKYIDPTGKALDVLVVEVSDQSKLDQARTSLRSFVIDHLTKSGKDYALAAFYSTSDDGEDWRFSFVKLEHCADVVAGRMKQTKEITPAKRYSFLVGAQAKLHTAQMQLIPLLQNVYNNPTIEQIENAFSIETVTDEFFERYKELFLTLSEHLSNDAKFVSDLSRSKVDVPRFTKKLLGQIVFLFFLQKKGWLGVDKDQKFGTGDKNFLNSLYELSKKEGKNFFRDYLQPLFYEALAKKHGDEGVLNYYAPLKCKIPFLNGGVFEADYNWKNDRLTVPNTLFKNSEIVSKTKDKGTGVLDVFNRYNFTIREEEPLEKEVAVDPEMVGKVFENLLEVKERKSKGAFYTPREIVHYMCQESLINFIDNNTQHKIPKEDIEFFIRNGHLVLENDKRVIASGQETKEYPFLLPQSVRERAIRIDEALFNIKICDPAIGSGAFPVGMLHELVNAQLVLESYMKDTEYYQRKLELLSKGETSINYAYYIKRHAIEKSIYGVDLDASAVDIARLRLWLSLIVDEENVDDIEALPNLDYKIVFGNSIVQRYALDTPINAVLKKQALKEYQELSDKFTKTCNYEDKQDFRSFIERIKSTFKTVLYKGIIAERINVEQKIADYQTISLFGFEKSVENKKRVKELRNELKEQESLILSNHIFKDSVEWRFEYPEMLDKSTGEFIGFDLVIGTPPLGAELSDVEKEILKNKYPYLVERIRNTFLYFLGLGDLIAPNGAICYLIPNEFLFQVHMAKARNYFLSKTRMIKAINIGESAFKAVVPTCIVLFDHHLKGSAHSIEVADFRNDSLKQIVDKLQLDKLQQISQSQILNAPKHIFSFDSTKSKIINAMIEAGKPFGDYCEDIANGISTACNDVYLVSQEEITNYNFEKDYVKPSLKGGDISKCYIPSSPPQYILYIDKDFKKESAPNIMAYLESNKSMLISKCVEKRSGKRDWWILFRSREEESLKTIPKILIRQTGDSIIAGIDRIGYYGIDSTNIITIKKAFVNSIKYYLAILNSELMKFYYDEISQESGSVVAQVKPVRVKSIPIIDCRDMHLFNILISYVEYLAQLKISSIVVVFYQSVMNAIVYEHYFYSEISSANKCILCHLSDLQPIDHIEDERKLQLINSEFERLYDPYHPVRNNVETLDQIEVIRIIKESLK